MLNYQDCNGLLDNVTNPGLSACKLNVQSFNSQGSSGSGSLPLRSRWQHLCRCGSCFYRVRRCVYASRRAVLDQCKPHRTVNGYMRRSVYAFRRAVWTSISLIGQSMEIFAVFMQEKCTACMQAMPEAALPDRIKHGPTF